MSARILRWTREAPVGTPCDFRHSEHCDQPATNYVEWDVDGLRERTLYCDKHAARELEQAYADYEALIDPFDEALLADQTAEGQPVEHVREERSRELAELRSRLF